VSGPACGGNNALRLEPKDRMVERAANGARHLSPLAQRPTGGRLTRGHGSQLAASVVSSSHGLG
jgi:hypothetical protein